MAIEYTIKAVCDQCGFVIEPETKVAKGKLDSMRWTWENKWKNTGVMRGLQPKFRQAKLFCSKCAGS